MRGLLLVVIASVVGFFVPTRADVLNLVNGDRFTGSVELVNASEVQIKSDALGIVKIPRAKVVSIFFGTNQPSSSITIGSAPAFGGFDPKSVDKVQEDFLGTAGPEANAMFKDLVQGLASGKLNVDDIRKQAADSLKELKELQGDDGEEGDNPIIQSYVGILENFIKQGQPNRAKGLQTKPPTKVEKPKAEDE